MQTPDFTVFKALKQFVVKEGQMQSDHKNHCFSVVGFVLISTNLNWLFMKKYIMATFCRQSKNLLDTFINKEQHVPIQIFIICCFEAALIAQCFLQNANYHLQRSLLTLQQWINICNFIKSQLIKGIFGAGHNEIACDLKRNRNNIFLPLLFQIVFGISQTKHLQRI